MYLLPVCCLCRLSCKHGAHADCEDRWNHLLFRPAFVKLMSTFVSMQGIVTSTVAEVVQVSGAYTTSSRASSRVLPCSSEVRNWVLWELKSFPAIVTSCGFSHCYVGPFAMSVDAVFWVSSYFCSFESFNIRTYWWLQPAVCEALAIERWKSLSCISVCIVKFTVPP